jgi:hypothetical protein
MSVPPDRAESVYRACIPVFHADNVYNTLTFVSDIIKWDVSVEMEHTRVALLVLVETDAGRELSRCLDNVLFEKILSSLYNLFGDKRKKPAALRKVILRLEESVPGMNRLRSCAIRGVPHVPPHSFKGPVITL